MSASSQTTLTSPSTKASHSTGLQRRASAHSHGAHHGHGAHPKRRASVHSHGHARRSSDGEAGRRAVAAGLSMHTLEPGKKKKQDRPTNIGSRSDTNLPTMTRTNSMVSVMSRNSDTSASRQGKSRLRSNSTKLLDEQGKELDPDDQEWESGEEKKKARKEKKKRAQSSSAMRRTVSETAAELQQGGIKPKPSIGPAYNEDDLVDPMDPDHRPLLTQRTTGFAGTVQPLDPQVAAEMPPTDHPIITNPVKRVASSKSLVGPISGMTSMANTPDGGVITESPEIDRAEFEKDKKKPSAHHLRSSSGNGIVNGRSGGKDKLDGSPSYPFPKMPSPNEQPGAEPPSNHREDKPREESSSEASTGQSGQRSRQASSKAQPTLRHRPSNSSLRSIQSLRAPPHPLNSPASYRRPGASDNYARDGKRDRVPSMHQPPVPQPQVNYEVAQGQGWDQIPEEGGGDRDGNSNASTAGSGSAAERNRSQNARRSSVASNRSLRAIFSGTLHPPPPASSQPTKRLTAHEAASAASKRPTTNNPALYHHSLGHPSSSAESCFLISRFLPSKRVERPKWEIDIHNMERVNNGGVGLTNGDYRSSHESLVRTFRQLGASGPQPAKRGVSRSYSTYGSILPSGLSLSSVAAATGMHHTNGTDSNKGLSATKGREGSKLEGAQGKAKGMSPFEMGVDRVLTQRPGRVAL